MFPCTGCGLCCQNISAITELKEFDLGNGVCTYYDFITNECKIYNDRPKICQVDKMFELKYNEYFTKEEFYIVNANACNDLQDKYSLDNSFKIDIKDLKCHYHF